MLDKMTGVVRLLCWLIAGAWLFGLIWLGITDPKLIDPPPLSGALSLVFVVFPCLWFQAWLGRRQEDRARAEFDERLRQIRAGELTPNTTFGNMAVEYGAAIIVHRHDPSGPPPRVWVPPSVEV